MIAGPIRTPDGQDSGCGASGTIQSPRLPNTSSPTITTNNTVALNASEP
jgi:hypothetical protein